MLSRALGSSDFVLRGEAYILRGAQLPALASAPLSSLGPVAGPFSSLSAFVTVYGVVMDIKQNDDAESITQI